MPDALGSELVLKLYAKSFRGPTLIRASLTRNEIFCKVHMKQISNRREKKATMQQESHHVTYYSTAEG
jgi:hypothetical protein